ncbi:MAG: hypothetical protein IKM83_07435 [Paludibacteraceae bacterium]|nr:hypothetical protein [Paludibacteraceae bacterium]
MKNSVPFVMLICLFSACTSDYRPERANEIVSGIVTNKEGVPLQGILITKYWDQELTQDVINQFRDSYTNDKGEYSICEYSRYTKNTSSTTFYLVATDPTGFYQEQKIESMMVYSYTLDAADAVGSATVNIVMEQ